MKVRQFLEGKKDFNEARRISNTALRDFRDIADDLGVEKITWKLDNVPEKKVNDVPRNETLFSEYQSKIEPMINDPDEFRDWLNNLSMPVLPLAGDQKPNGDWFIQDGNRRILLAKVLNQSIVKVEQATQVPVRFADKENPKESPILTAEGWYSVRGNASQLSVKNVVQNAIERSRKYDTWDDLKQELKKRDNFGLYKRFGGNKL